MDMQNSLDWKFNKFMYSDVLFHQHFWCFFLVDIWVVFFFCVSIFLPFSRTWNGMISSNHHPKLFFGCICRKIRLRLLMCGTGLPFSTSIFLLLLVCQGKRVASENLTPPEGSRQPAAFSRPGFPPPINEPAALCLKLGNDVSFAFGIAKRPKWLKNERK